MKHNIRSSKGALLLAGLLAGGIASAWAQQGTAETISAPAATSRADDAIQGAENSARPSAENQRIEHLTHEDSGSRVDELRVGGRSKSVTVTPKNGAPSYQIVPDDPSRGITGSSGGDGDNRSGRRVWRLGTF